jgi:hypothetical protein
MARLRITLLSLTAILASLTMAAADDGPLFPAHEIGFSVFGETANGRVDVRSQQTVVRPSVTKARFVGYRIVSVRLDPPFLPKFILVSFKPRQSPEVVHFVRQDRTEHNAGGGGIRFSYFWSRYMGIAADGAFLGGETFNTAVTGNLILRYPFEFGGKAVAEHGKNVVRNTSWGLAPYMIAGGGGQFCGRNEGVGDAGGGVELRLGKHYSLFAESRWVVSGERRNYAATIAGVSYTF